MIRNREPLTSSGPFASGSIMGNPRFVYSLLALACVAAVMAADTAGGGILAILALIAVPFVALGCRHYDKVLLGVLLLRPVLAIVPEFSIAGQQIGIDGMVNMAVLLILSVVLVYHRPLPVTQFIFWIFALFLLVCLVSIRLSSDPTLGIRQWIRFSGYLIYFMAAYTLAYNRSDFPNTLRRLIVSLTVLLLGMGALQMLLMLRELSPVEYVRLMFEGELEYRLDGFQDYPHTYGNMMLVCAAFLMAYAWAEKDNRLRRVLYLLAMAAISAVVVTGVRSLFVALAVMIVVGCIGAGKYRQLLVLCSIGLVLGFSTGIFQARLSAFTDPSRALEWNSLQDRREIWEAVDKAIAVHPWQGYGLGSVYDFVSESPIRHSTESLGSHCDFRKFWFEAGLFGGLLFTLLWVALVFTAWYKRRTSEFSRYAGPALSSIGLAFITIALVDSVFQDYLAMSVVWFAFGAFMGATTKSRESSLAGTASG
ncbi:MAG: hypothetical protein AMXMBFR84_23070 [Candidatus Hydrogenedentota bacterium]